MPIVPKLALALSVSSLALCVPVGTAHAAQQQRLSFRLPAQSLARSLRAVSLQAGRSIAAPAHLLRGRNAPAIAGDYAVEDAVAALLSGSGLIARQTASGLVIERGVPIGASGEEEESEAIVVTGSRIRGAPIASPVLRFDQESMRDGGQTSLTEVVRRIPQAFGGGQNFGVGANVGSANGIDVGGAVTINLRGLGSDATLTLLNGHRLAYNGSRQGIDVSSIPLAAVDRLEIVADGASALYGSDAVAGVANIILKRDFEGLQLEGEAGVATAGDFARQRLAATAGARWPGGGVIASYEYARSAALFSDDRDFAQGRPGVIIYPPLDRHAAVLAGHQDLTSSLHFTFDMLFNRRWTEIGFPDNAAGDRAVSHTEQPTTSRSFAVAPALRLDLPGRWQAALAGVYGNERVFTRANNYVGASFVRSTPLCYCNDGKSVELSADGPLFALPGGPARIAMGAGWRTNLLNADRGPGQVANVRQSQASYHGYAELSLPLVAPDLGLPGVDRLNLGAALRYERYPGVDTVVTPKIGLVYAPLAWIDVKASWGRSFRAPTLLQQYQVASAVLFPVTRLGGTGYPAGATALLVSGGNTAVRPEHARTVSATLDLRPPFLDKARLQLSWFNTRYVDRIVTPIALTAQALVDPAYADLVTLAPGPAQAAAVIAASPQFVNASGAAADPARVVAIVDNRFLNAGRQTIHGMDILADYRFRLGTGEITAALNASYLSIEQQLGPGQPILPRSGLLFTPPDWRARASLTWVDGPLTLNGSLNLTQSVDDTRTATPIRVHGVTTLDLTARYRLSGRGKAAGGMTLNVSLQNALGADPDRIASSSQIDSSFDSTNFSPLGRVAMVGVTASW